MKRGTALQLSWLGLAAAVLLAALTSPAVPAQSGRRIVPTPTPTPEAGPTPKPEEPKFVPDPDAEKYRLVFATRYEGRFSFRDADELQLIRRSAFDDFVGQLNRAGAEGYRVVTSLKGDPAVVALGQEQFEYAWTETASRDEFFKRGFSGTYAQLAKRGFRLAAHALLYGYCEPLFPDRCDYRDFFLFERRKGDETPREFKTVDTERGAAKRKGATREDVLTDAVNARRAEGFYPAQFLSKSEIVLEREPPEPALAEAGAEVRVLRSDNFWERDELPKKVNELARQGFRLALADHEIAVMYRRAGERAPLGYVWLKGSDKDFERELARLQEAGAVFRTTYPDSGGARRSLVFEQGAGGGARREYRVLRFELQTRENSAEQVLETTLAPASAGAQGELNRLAVEGFAVLALFDADRYKFTKAGKGREATASEEFGILLERKP
ncbi:MAG TPA: hypothetical protein VN282_03155 [Pyrinomonadaceae bacterium]|nr:hypothetical protein [Pyrinomonadaceae bacterium]